eukprot:267387-Amorphochlora_amoeboformis.AAC.1
MAPPPLFPHLLSPSIISLFTLSLFLHPFHLTLTIPYAIFLPSFPLLPIPPRTTSPEVEKVAQGGRWPSGVVVASDGSYGGRFAKDISMLFCVLILIGFSRLRGLGGREERKREREREREERGEDSEGKKEEACL